MATIVLLGAGASFGSNDVSPYPPPLGSDLFKKLEDRGGIAGSLSDELKEKFIDNFETGMALYYKVSGGNIMAFQRELSLYLAEFKPGKNNVYRSLISTLGDSKIIYSSLNYDLLFELAASQLGFFTTYDSTYQSGGVRLLKIHGSSNFWPDLQGSTFKGCVFSNNKVDVQMPVKPLNQENTLARCAQDDSLAPAMAMFAAGKEIKVCPDYVARQYSQWVSKVKRSSRIFVSGVRVHEMDEHIWSVLGKCKAWLGYFGFESDKPEFEVWKKRHRKQNAIFFENDFESAIDVMKARATKT